MTDKEHIRSMESKIQEIERLVAEVVKEHPNYCTVVFCSRCDFRHPETTVKGQVCNLLFKKTWGCPVHIF